MADLSGWIDGWARHTPDATALDFEGRSTTYRDLARRIEGWARALHRVGVGEGDRVAVLAFNHPAVVELVFAAARLGAVFVPLNHRLTPAEHRWQLDHAEPTVVVADHRFAGHLTACWDGPVLGLDAVDHVGDDGGDAPRRGTPDHAVILAYTSGTTGHPKGAVISQRSVAANAVNATHCHDLQSTDRVLTVLPLFHLGGLNIQTLPALGAGAAVRLHERFDPAAWLADVEEWRVTQSLLVPAVMQAVLDHDDLDFALLGSLRGLQCGSSTIPEPLIRGFLERGVPVGQVYGATETGPVAVYLRAVDGADHVGSCGRAGTLTELRIVDDDGVDITAGRSGELWLRADHLVSHYWRDPDATEAAFTDGWFRTGDVGHVDDDGWIFIDDRRTDVVISGGENVYPAELEAVLADCPGLVEATVVGRPHDRWGETPVVVAVRAAGATVTDADVLARFEDRLARFKHPTAVEWVDALPRTALGKVQKHLL